MYGPFLDIHAPNEIRLTPKLSANHKRIQHLPAVVLTSFWPVMWICSLERVHCVFLGAVQRDAVFVLELLKLYASYRFPIPVLRI